MISSSDIVRSRLQWWYIARFPENISRHHRSWQASTRMCKLCGNFSHRSILPEQQTRWSCGDSAGVSSTTASQSEILSTTAFILVELNLWLQHTTHTRYMFDWHTSVRNTNFWDTSSAVGSPKANNKMTLERDRERGEFRRPMWKKNRGAFLRRYVEPGQLSNGHYDLHGCKYAISCHVTTPLPECSVSWFFFNSNKAKTPHDRTSWSQSWAI